MGESHVSSSCRSYVLPLLRLAAPTSCRSFVLPLLRRGSLVTLCLFALAPSAHAGYWLFSAIGSGAAHDTHPPATGEPKTYSPWIIPAPTVGSFSVPQFGTSSGYDSQADASITLTVKATWTHGTGETDANDPAPPSVWLAESSEAEFTANLATGNGNANDGLGDVVSAGTTGKATSSFGTTKPPEHWTNVTVSGGVAKLPERTLSATANFPANPSSP